MVAAGHVQVSSAPPEMESWLATFKHILTQLKGQATKDVGTWAGTSAPARTDELLRLIARVDSAATSINVHVTAVEERVKRQRKAEVADTRRAQSERTRLLSSWRSSSISSEARVPMTLLRYMLYNGLLVTGHGDTRKV